ncbi:MAG: cytochrome b/b6 domain-containing protein, partial [Acetobacteraceae bacterium]|nr:cytochrome b/b6 domain-containing protein [Acetobacteraceae bacterium]
MLRDYTQRSIRLPMRVWDLPIRLFHWAIVLLVIVAYVSQRLGRMDLHILTGLTIMTLLLFRLVWGFIGSETARFGKFLRNPITGLRHLAHFGGRDPDDTVGHNEAGGWMVLVLLLLLVFQVGTGLFANRDGIYQGPLASYVGSDRSDQISGWHALNFNLILAAIVLHILAVIAYAVVKRH